jgi:hypothetical protein
MLKRQNQWHHLAETEHMIYICWITHGDRYERNRSEYAYEINML